MKDLTLTVIKEFIKQNPLNNGSYGRFDVSGLTARVLVEYTNPRYHTVGPLLIWDHTYHNCNNQDKTYNLPQVSSPESLSAGLYTHLTDWHEPLKVTISPPNHPSFMDFNRPVEIDLLNSALVTEEQDVALVLTPSAISIPRCSNRYAKVTHVRKSMQGDLSFSLSFSGPLSYSIHPDDGDPYVVETDLFLFTVDDLNLAGWYYYLGSDNPDVHFDLPFDAGCGPTTPCGDLSGCTTEMEVIEGELETEGPSEVPKRKVEIIYLGKSHKSTENLQVRASRLDEPVKIQVTAYIKNEKSGEEETATGSASLIATCNNRTNRIAIPISFPAMGGKEPLRFTQHLTVNTKVIKTGNSPKKK